MLQNLLSFCIIQHRQNPEEHEPLSSAFDGPSPTSAIVALDTDLDTSSLDTYRAPPAPLPYDLCTLALCCLTYEKMLVTTLLVLPH